MQKPFSVAHADLQDILQEFITELIDSCLMDGILTMHRAIKLGYFHIIAPEPDHDISDSIGNGTSNSGSSRDPNKTASCCRCGKCNCKVAATRYAVHLSNCMGLGRNSSRRANKRIAEQQRLEDDDTETEENFESSGDIISYKNSATPSDQLECKYSNGAVNRHRSPLKLTISLVPGSGKPDHTSKHSNRQLESAASGNEFSCLNENSLKPLQSSHIKSNLPIVVSEPNT
ncbi:Ataxin-7-like protein [Schistosoma japonicum]|uniref:SAGA-associated factor 11 n=1 Tax=Schistosoma japonicum TaxID=6182 RepID=B3W656_SCHJA|nr:Ataxin-7-like protein 3 [Schistosoma japonicum]KAH8863731.1 Ataxin-7-like protein 3 [Schistosoma japonicum]KAH8863732.1 Ataxin-7-like protein 3 [Schistosoma japonicum]TNN09470.1 Ataxin-7-like protein [Schistosoma japonicum]